MNKVFYLFCLAWLSIGVVYSASIDFFSLRENEITPEVIEQIRFQNTTLDRTAPTWNFGTTSPIVNLPITGNATFPDDPFFLEDEDWTKDFTQHIVYDGDWSNLYLYFNTPTQRFDISVDDTVGPLALKFSTRENMEHWYGSEILIIGVSDGPTRDPSRVVATIILRVTVSPVDDPIILDCPEEFENVDPDTGTTYYAIPMQEDSSITVNFINYLGRALIKTVDNLTNPGDYQFFITPDPVTNPPIVAINPPPYDNKTVTFTPRADFYGDATFVITNVDNNINNFLDINPELNVCRNVFKIRVANIPDPPVINSYFPSNLNLQLIQGDSQVFSVNAFDPVDEYNPLGPELTYSWRIVGSNFGTPIDFEFSTNSNTSYDFDFPGDFTVTLVVSDGTHTLSPIVWNVNVTPNGPIFFPLGGVYTESVEVMLSTPTEYPNAPIYYSLDGSTPTSSSMLYTGPIPVELMNNDNVVSISAIFIDPVFGPSAVITQVYHITGQVGLLEFDLSPLPFIYHQNQELHISTSTIGAQIYYTLDGSDPAISGILYDGFIPLTNVEYDGTIYNVRAIAKKNLWIDSPEIQDSFRVTGKVRIEPPTAFSPPAGTYNLPIGSIMEVFINDVTLYPDESGTVLRYSLTGTPTESSPIYDPLVPFALQEPTIIRIRAFRQDWEPSDVWERVYMVNSRVVITNFANTTSPFSPPPGAYTYPINVQINTITIPTNGRVYYSYSLNGTEPPDPDDSFPQYSGPIAIPNFTNAIIKAIAYHDDPSLLPSLVYRGVYNVTGPVATPTFMPPPGAYAVTQYITISSNTENVQIYYTVSNDGSDPENPDNMGNGLLYDPTPVTGSIIPATEGITIIKAIAYRNGYAESAIGRGVYYINLLAPPNFTLDAAPLYTQPISIEITADENPATQIRFTTDGSTPNATSTLYTGPTQITLSPDLINYNVQTLTVNARAFRDGWNPSVTASRTYTVTGKVATPSFFGNLPGNYANTVMVSLETLTPSATIYYTTDGSTPNENSTLYMGPFAVSSTVTIRARAYRNDWEPSDVSIDGNFNIAGSVAMPIFTPPAGTYPTTQQVFIFSLTPGVNIHYTVNGANPTIADPILAPNTSLTINADSVIRAIASLPGGNVSSVATASYIITGIVAVPVFSPPSGAYASTQYVSISSPTPGATIYYTRNNSTPTVAPENLYTTPVEVAYSQTIKAIAVKPYWANSNVGIANYLINGKVQLYVSPLPGTYYDNQQVSLTAFPNDAAIYYTTDGTDPTPSSNLYNGNPILLTQQTTLKAFAIRNTWQDSDIKGGLYSFAVQNPGFSHAGGTYSAYFDLSIINYTAGASIRYTLDGSDPKIFGELYDPSNPISITGSTTVRAYAFKTGWEDSEVVTAVYSISGGVLTPQFSLQGGVYNAPILLSISSFPSDATIRYTTNGEEPTQTTGAVYGGAIQIAENTTVKAIAFKPNWLASPVATADYTFQPQNPVISPIANASVPFDTPINVSIETVTPDSRIYYSLDGSDPDENSGLLYSGVFSIDTATLVKARAYSLNANWDPSQITGMNYTFRVKSPSFSPLGGLYSAAQSVRIFSATQDASIYYTLDGSDPSLFGTLLTADSSISINTATTIRAIARKVGWLDSEIAEASYTFELPAPVFNRISGTYANDLSVEISATTGAQIRYTTNGDDPTATSTLYNVGSALSITENTTLKAKAFLVGWNPSATTSATYSFKVADPVFLPMGGVYTAAQQVLLNSPTSGATIIYTLDNSEPTQSNGIIYNSSNPINVPERTNLAIKARAFKANWLSSDIVTEAYSITGPVLISGEVFSPVPGNYTTVQNISVNPTLGLDPTTAILRYTLDGSEPSEASPVFNSSISAPLGTITTIKVKAFLAGWAPSETITGIFNVTGTAGASSISFNPPAGTYNLPQSVSINSVLIPLNAILRYTTDGTDPVETSQEYTGPITVPAASTTTIKARAFATNWMPGPVVSAVYVINPPVSFVEPLFTPPSGTYSSSDISVQIGATIPSDAIIYYTVDGSDPDQSSAVYTGSVLVSANIATVIKARAYAVGYAPSNIINAVYNASILPALVFSPISGIYTAPQSLNISVPGHSDATLYYTLDGSEPNQSSLTALPLAMGLNSTYSVRAKAYKNGFFPIEGSAYYSITGTVADPVFSLAGGTYPGAQILTLSTSTEGAIIRYTTDGSEPTNSSQRYIQAIAIDSSQTIKARAFKENWIDSNTITNTYIINGAVVLSASFNPVAGTYTDPVSVTISASTIPNGATLRYTTDGSEPNAASPVYSTSILVNSNSTIKVKAFLFDWLPSETVSADYVITGTVLLSADMFDPIPGTYTSGVSVSLNDVTIPAGATLRYTTDGSLPTTTSQIYTVNNPIVLPLDSSTTIRVRGFYPNWNPSLEASGTYSITGGVALNSPLFSPLPGTYTSAQTVTLTGVSPAGAQIHYTTDGSEPTVASPIYSGSIDLPLGSSTTIRVRGFKAGYTPSPIVEGMYYITGQVAVIQPVFDPLPGTYFTPQQVNLVATTNPTGATFRYTTDGSNPDASSAIYSAAIPIPSESQVLLKVRAFATDWLPSEVYSGLYNITGQVAAVTFTPDGGTFMTSQNVSLSTTTLYANIRYTLDGSEPTESSALYTSAINIPVNSVVTIKAKAFRSGWQASPTTQRTFTITDQVEIVGTPFSLNPGLYQTAINVAVTATTNPSDAIIRYTLDGSEPTSTSLIYSAAINIPLNTASITITIRAFKDGWLASETISATYTVTGQIQLPSALFTPVPGTYQTAQMVTLNTATTPAGAILRYTTDGSDPLASSAAYVNPISIPLNSSITIKVKAFKQDWLDSGIASGMYNVTGQVAFNTPVFNPTPGFYDEPVTVTLAATVPNDANIYYTIDGTDPTLTNGMLYTGSIMITNTTTIKAVAYRDGWLVSAIQNATYTMGTKPPVFTPEAGAYPTAQTITLSSLTVGANIRYTTDGSNPSATVGTLYSAPFTISQSTIVKAIAFANGHVDSPIVSAVYAINGAVASPMFNPLPGIFSTNQTVSISAFPSDATIRYTTDGSDPSITTGTIYTAPVAINQNTTLKAIAYKTDWITSNISMGSYQFKTATPVMSLAAGTYPTAQTLSLSVSTPGAIIRYTTDGTDPSSTNGTVYATPIAIAASQTVKAIAIKAGWLNSDIVSRAYLITGTVANVTFNPNGGTYQTAQNISLSTTTGSATIRYTIDGSDPTEASASYIGIPINVPLNSTVTIKARAFRSDWIPSAITQQTYVITGQIAIEAPVFSPAPGTYTTAQNITVNVPVPASAQIRYTLDGNEPTATSQLYTGPLPLALNSTMNLKVKAFLANWTPSLTYSATYTATGTVQMTAPVFAPAPGLYTSAQQVTINTITTPANATIRYTMDGSDPNETSAIYTAPINLANNTSTTIRARAFVADWIPSPIQTAVYNITGTVAIPGTVFTPAAGLYTSTQYVSVNTNTNPAGATIRYTLDGSEPNQTSEEYTSAIELTTGSHTLKVKAFRADWISSPTYSASYTITGQIMLTSDVLSPAPGLYTTAQSINVTGTANPSTASIRFTTDGSEPDVTSPIFIQEIQLPLNTESFTLKLKAFLQNWIESETITAEYRITGQVALPSTPFSLPAGVYTSTTTLSINPPVLPSYATIRYTINDDNDPTMDSPTYTSPLILNTNSTYNIKIRGFATDWLPSEVMSATYVVTGTVAAPEMSHISGIYNEAIELSLTTATAGAQIRYTTDGSDPDENSNLYSEPITIPDLAQNFIVKAKAFKADWISSSVTSATYSVLLLPMDVRAYSYAGYIRVLWNTPIVPRSLDGFDVYRRKLNETVFVKMNSTIIPASQELVYHYDDYQVQTNQSYQYYVVAIYNAVSSNPSVTTTVEYQSQDLVISDATHAYPNPATTSTKIKMIMTRNENVQISVSIFDFAGKKVRTLTVPTTSVNLIEIPWDLKNSSGEKVGRGTYFARIVANDGVKRAEKIVKIAVK